MITSHPHLSLTFSDYSQAALFHDFEVSYQYWKTHSIFPSPSENTDLNAPQPILPGPDFSAWLQQSRHFDKPRIQKYFTSTTNAARLDQFRKLLRESNSIRDIVRFQSLDQSITGALLRTWPKNEWRVHNNAFAISCRFRLGLPVFPSLVLHPQRCRCTSTPAPPIDPFGNHLCCCRSGGEVTLRHNQVITCLRDLAKLGGITSSESYLHRAVPGTLEVADFDLFRPNFLPMVAVITSMIHLLSILTVLTNYPFSTILPKGSRHYLHQKFQIQIRLRSART